MWQTTPEGERKVLLKASSSPSHSALLHPFIPQMRPPFPCPPSRERTHTHTHTQQGRGRERELLNFLPKKGGRKFCLAVPSSPSPPPPLPSASKNTRQDRRRTDQPSWQLGAPSSTSQPSIERTNERARDHHHPSLPLPISCKSLSKRTMKHDESKLGRRRRRRRVRKGKQRPPA